MITLTAGRYRIDEPWNPDLIRAIRSIPGRRVEDHNVWTIPAQFHRQVKVVSESFGLVFPGPPDGDIVPATITSRKDSFEVRFDFTDQGLVGVLAGINGSVWYQPKECWLVPHSEGVALDQWAKMAAAHTDDRSAQAIHYAYGAMVRWSASAAKSTDWELTRPGFGLTLFPEQTAGVDYILNHAGGRCIIGDEMGVGKTAQALAAIHEAHAFPALIVPPSSLKVNWRREARRALPYASVEIVRGTQPIPRLLWADVVIINYDILHAWELNLPEYKSIVFDESHWIMSPKARRTKSALRLAAQIPDGGLALCMTGTPTPNQPNEIMTQLEAIGKIDVFGGPITARKRWKNRGGHLNRTLRETCYIRRLKKDVWVDAPGRHWAELYVEGVPEVMEEYYRAEADIVAYLGEKARIAVLESGATTEEAQRAAWEAALRANAAEHLVAITHLKQLAAQAALPAVKAWVNEQPDKVGLFAWHRVIVDDLAESLNGVKVQGGMSETERQRSVDYFQTKPEVKVFVGQIKAAGEGLTLTAAHTALLVELPWNQAAMDQALDRFHRRGQEHDVMGYVVQIEGTITEDILDLIRRKQADIEAVVDGNETGAEKTILGDLVVRLAGRAMR